jgi:hypothetical protein
MGFFGIIKLVLWVVVVDCVLVGLLIATIYWFVDLYMFYLSVKIKES